MKLCIAIGFFLFSVAGAQAQGNRGIKVQPTPTVAIPVTPSVSPFNANANRISTRPATCFRTVLQNEPVIPLSSFSKPGEYHPVVIPFTTNKTGNGFNCFDRGNDFSNQTGKFTVPEDGFYHFDVKISFADEDMGPNGGRIELRLVCDPDPRLDVEANQYSELIRNFDKGSSYSSITLSETLYLFSGTRISVQIAQFQDPKPPTRSLLFTDQSSFEGFRIQ